MKPRGDLLLAVISGAILGFTLADAFRPRPEITVTLAAPGSSWTRSDDHDPPNNQPIVGYWIDGGQRIIREAVGAGGRWFEYTGIDGPAPIIAHAPPIEWIGQPGAAQ